MASYQTIADVATQANTRSHTLLKTMCLVASLLAVGTAAAVYLSAHNTGLVSSYSAPALGTAVQVPAAIMQTPSFARNNRQPTMLQSGVGAVPTLAFVDVEQASRSSSPLAPVCGVFAASVVGAALVAWYRASQKMGTLKPAYMEFGQQETIAMFYLSGQQTTGRKSMAAYNLFDRMGRLVRSNVTWVVQQLEDPEKVIEQAVIDMQADLVKIRQSYSEVLATQKRTEVKQRQLIENVEQWQKRAELALVKGDEELAREALRRKNVEQKALDGVNAQLAQSGPIAENLLNAMKVLEQKLDEAKANKAQLIARAKSAETSKKVNDMLTGLDTGSAMSAFDRMEEKVQQLEANAEVSGILAEGSTLDKRFKALEGSSAVDDDLAALKRQLEGPKEQAYLPPSKSEEDEEIERIRKALKGM